MAEECVDEEVPVFLFVVACRVNEFSHFEDIRHPQCFAVLQPLGRYRREGVWSFRVLANG